jgi:hypothetical protein
MRLGVSIIAELIGAEVFGVLRQQLLRVHLTQWEARTRYKEQYKRYDCGGHDGDGGVTKRIKSMAK